MRWIALLSIACGGAQPATSVEEVSEEVSEAPPERAASAPLRLIIGEPASVHTGSVQIVTTLPSYDQPCSPDCRPEELTVPMPGVILVVDVPAAGSYTLAIESEPGALDRPGCLGWWLAAAAPGPYDADLVSRTAAERTVLRAPGAGGEWECTEVDLGTGTQQYGIEAEAAGPMWIAIHERADGPLAEPLQESRCGALRVTLQPGGFEDGCV